MIGTKVLPESRGVGWCGNGTCRIVCGKDGCVEFGGHACTGQSEHL